jgi:hypothetical protein
LFQAVYGRLERRAEARPRFIIKVNILIRTTPRYKDGVLADIFSIIMGVICTRWLTYRIVDSLPKIEANHFMEELQPINLKKMISYNSARPLCAGR